MEVGIYIVAGLVAVVVIVLMVLMMPDWFGVFSGIFTGLVLGGLTWLIILLIGFFMPSIPVEEAKETNIYALKDNSQTNGAFSLGTGYINEDQYYFYVTETEKGKKVNKVKADNSYIKEESDSEPKLLEYKHKFKSKVARFMYGEYNGISEYVFIVPENTVTTEFNVDME